MLTTTPSITTLSPAATTASSLISSLVTTMASYLKSSSQLRQNMFFKKWRIEDLKLILHPPSKLHSLQFASLFAAMLYSIDPLSPSNNQSGRERANQEMDSSISAN